MKPPVRFSRLKNIGRSPAHYIASLDDDSDTPFRRKGRAVHSFLLGRGEVTIYEEGQRRGKAWDAFKAQHDESTILIPSEAVHVNGMRRAVEEHAEASRLLQGVQEQTLWWTLGGQPCQGTPDVRSTAVVELKTCRTSEPARFVRAAQQYAYHAQLAWYQDGIELAGHERPEEAYIVAVESAPPYAVTVLQMTERALDMGRRMCRLWLERLRACEESDVWPAYTEATLPFDIDDPDDGFSLVIDGEEQSFGEVA